MQKIKLKSDTFRLIIGLPEVREVRAILGIDLLDRDGIGKACESLIDFADVIKVCLQSQIETAELTDREFYDQLLDNCEAAVDAFLEELSDFFRRCGKAALAQLASAVVETNRESDRMAEEMFTADRRKQLISLETGKMRKTRQKALDDLLSSDDTTPGEKSTD